MAVAFISAGCSAPARPGPPTAPNAKACAAHSRSRGGEFFDFVVATKLPPHPEEAVTSAFTRVCDALWPPSRRMATSISLPALVLRDAIPKRVADARERAYGIAPQDEGSENARQNVCAV
jgi:hypothetical protein